MRTCKVAVLIGRFQPFHNGHQQVIREALLHADNVVVVIGSADEAISYYNPFTYSEREQMIHSAVGWNKRVWTIGVSDFTYNEDLWVEAVQDAVLSIAKEYPDVFTNIEDKDIRLIGHSKDSTSYYLKMFPQWKSINVPLYENGLSATSIREDYFGKVNSDWATKFTTPIETLNFLQTFEKTDRWLDMHEEYVFIQKYGDQWGRGPFVTTDAVVVQSGHVLMIRRGGRPGKGLLALPGGFLNRDEFIKEGMLRELREETLIDVPPAVLRGSILASEVFDSPRRDPRARIITHAFLVNLPKATKLPKVKGSDDAASAEWVPLAELNGSDCFGDHWHIVQRMRGYIPKDAR